MQCTRLTRDIKKCIECTVRWMTTTHRCYYGVTWSEKGSERTRMWTRTSEVVHSVAEAYTVYDIKYTSVRLFYHADGEGERRMVCTAREKKKM